MITPREIIRDYVTLLDLLCTNPEYSFRDIFAANPVAPALSGADAEQATTEVKSTKVTLEDIEF